MSDVVRDSIGTVERYRQRHVPLLAPLKHVNAALSQWDEYEANLTRPPELQCEVKPPELAREALKGLQVMLVGLLGEWEEGWEARN